MQHSRLHLICEPGTQLFTPTPSRAWASAGFSGSGFIPQHHPPTQVQDAVEAAGFPAGSSSLTGPYACLPAWSFMAKVIWMGKAEVVVQHLRVICLTGLLGSVISPLLLAPRN